MVSASIFVAGIATILQSKGVGFRVGSQCLSGMIGTDFTFANPAISVGSQWELLVSWVQPLRVHLLKSF